MIVSFEHKSRVTAPRHLSERLLNHGSISTCSVNHHQLSQENQNCVLFIKKVPPIQKQTHFHYSPANRVADDTFSHSYTLAWTHSGYHDKSFPDDGSCSHVSWHDKTVWFSVTAQRSSLLVWFSVASPVQWWSAPGPLEFRELNEVPVYFCHVPAAWLGWRQNI